MTPETTPRSPEEATLLDLATRRLPGGVLGTSRYRDDLAFVVRRAEGSHLWDWSGREYIDYLLSSGPMFLGHGHPAVAAPPRRAVRRRDSRRSRAPPSPRRGGGRTGRSSTLDGSRAVVDLLE